VVNLTSINSSTPLLNQPLPCLGLANLGGGEIDLAGLGTADSFAFHKDLLSIFARSKVIDTLNLHDSIQHGFVVEPPAAAGSGNMMAITYTIPMSLPPHNRIGQLRG
jgi:hypothetical protein